MGTNCHGGRNMGTSRTGYPLGKDGRSDMDPSGPFRTVLPLDEVTGALEALTKIFETEDDFELVLRQVCYQVVCAVPDIAEASITLLYNEEPHTAVATSDV